MRATRVFIAAIVVLTVMSARAYADSHAGAVHGNSSAASHVSHAPTTTPHSGTTPHSTTPPSSTPPSSTTPTTPTTTAPLNPIASKIASHPQLNARITALLPPHTTLNQASAGFRNQGQFIATLHAAQRLNCATCFTQLKTDMTVKGLSLGQAIQDVRHTSPSTATTVAHDSEHDAEVDIEIASR